jgi:hypothetical protein
MPSTLRGTFEFGSRLADSMRWLPAKRAAPFGYAVASKLKCAAGHLKEKAGVTSPVVV